MLDFDEVRVPVENRIGEVGEGWRVMTVGLNLEQALICAQSWDGWASCCGIRSPPHKDGSISGERNSLEEDLDGPKNLP
jgi:hypothetical protein